METTTGDHSRLGDLGRLGNQIIRNVAVSLIAKKHNLYVNYYNYELIKKLGIELFIGEKKHDKMINLTDDNYFSILNELELDTNLDPRQSFFQTKEIIDLIYNEFHRDSVKKTIMEQNEFNVRYDANNDLFIHIRLTDVEDKNPGINYYMESIKGIEFDNLYIASDHTNHPMIREIQKIYQNARILHCNEIETIKFGSTCKNIILSHGTFSAMIGYLAFYSNVHYPEYMKDKLWHGDIFSIEGWNQQPLHMQQPQVAVQGQVILKSHKLLSMKRFF